MAKQILNIGFVQNDGTGTNLRAGGTIINANFNEIYSAIGNGTSITLTATPTELNLLAGATTVTTNTNAVTLTNKTINLTSNTLTGTTAQFNTALSDGDFATLTGTETLTNKTLTTPIISSISNTGTITLPISTDTLVGRATTDTLTNKSISLTTNTVTGTIAQFNTAVSDADLATLAGSETLTNKSISGSTNTLSNIANSSLTNSSTKFVDTTSTVTTIPLGETLKILGSGGVTSTISGNTLTIGASSVPNASLANSTVLIGGNTITLGAAATTSISNLSLTGTGIINTTGSQNKIRQNFTGSSATLLANVTYNPTTYQGAFAVPDGTTKAYFADSGGWNEIVSENSSINILSDVDTSTNAPLAQMDLVWNSTSAKFVPGAGDSIKTAALIDVTVSGSSSYLFNSHYSGNNPTLYFKPGHTYAFKLDVTASHPFHLQTVAGAYSAGDAYSTGLTHIALTGAVTTGSAALLKNSGTLYYEVPSNLSTTIYYVCQNHSAMNGKIIIGNITETATGDGSATTITINSGRNVNDLLVFVNGLCLRPTTDYTISGTTLTFASPPALAAAIIVRYL
jgi:hypothetical protein